MEPGNDRVDNIQAQWRRERPDLDVTPMGIIGRLHRLAAALTEELVGVYEQHGLSEGEFDVLATLRRSGDPYARQPADLAKTTMITTGGLTKRLDRLEQAGLVERTRPDGADARTKLVRLTREGQQRIDDAITAHVANEARLVNQLPAADREPLEQLLREWLGHFESNLNQNST